MITADQLIKKLKGKKWHYIHRRLRSPFYMYLLWDGCSNRYNKNIPFAYHKVDWAAMDQEIAALEEPWEKMRKVMHREMSKKPGLLYKLLQDSYKLNKKIEKFCKNLETKNFDKASDADLLKKWEFYIDLFNRFAGYVLLPLFIEPDMESDLRKAIAKTFPGENVETVFQILTTPQKLGAAQKDEEALLKLGIKMNRGKLSKADVVKYQRDFSWIKNNSFVGTFYSEAECLKRIKNAAQHKPEARLREFLSKHKQAAQQFKKYSGKFKDKSAKILLATLQECIFHRSWRTERYYRNAYYLKNLYAATAKSFGLKHEGDLFYMVPPEVISALKGGKVPYKEIEERKVGYMVYTDPTISMIISGKDLAKAKKNISFFGSKKTTDLKGLPAYPGRVVGSAIVIHSKKELHRIKPGCILVAPSTTVDFVPYLKKVKAIVTNEGGVLSHASVISRELHIPCVIGTKVGTHNLKDGMKLEVDATKGIVKVI